MDNERKQAGELFGVNLDNNKEPKQKFEDKGNVRFYPNKTGSNMDSNNRWIGERYSLSDAWDFPKRESGLRDLKNLPYVDKTKNGADIFQLPDGYYSMNPNINSLSFKTINDVNDYEDFYGRTMPTEEFQKSGKSIDELYFNELDRRQKESDINKQLGGRGFEMDDGNFYGVELKDGKLRIGGVTNSGLMPVNAVDYDYDLSLDENLERLYDKFSQGDLK